MNDAGRDTPACGFPGGGFTRAARMDTAMANDVFPSCDDARATERLIGHIRDILLLPNVSEGTPLPEEIARAKGLEEILPLLWDVRHMVAALAHGELEYAARTRGFVVDSLKSFQGSLCNLAWQTQCIVDGDAPRTDATSGDRRPGSDKIFDHLAWTINELACASETYKDLSLRDPLTGLYNRRGFSKLAARLLDGEQRDNPAMLVMVDLDHFKEINDRHGHLFGDSVLRAIAGVLRSGLRADDVCCRYGGEEFVILMPSTTREMGLAVAERLLRDVAATRFGTDDISVTVTASFGLARVKLAEDGPLEDALRASIGRADAKLYRAKQDGRNRVVI